MGRGSSKAATGGGGGNAIKTETTPVTIREQRAFVDELSDEMVRDLSPEDRESGTFFSNSDMEAAVEAYALEHGLDEDSLMRDVREKVEAKMPNKTISNKAFNQNDYTTWPVGTEVEYTDKDFGMAEGKVRSKTYVSTGKVKEVYKDHLMVDIDGVSYWIDKDSQDHIKAKKKKK